MHRAASLLLLLPIASAGCGRAPGVPEVNEGPSDIVNMPVLVAPTSAQRQEAEALEKALHSSESNTAGPLELRGERVGAMTLDQFQKKFPKTECDWLPDKKDNIRTAFLKDPGMLADHPIVAAEFTFYGGVLERITLTPKSDADRLAILDQFAETLGPPQQQSESRIWRDRTATLVGDPTKILLFDRDLTQKQQSDAAARASTAR